MKKAVASLLKNTKLLTVLSIVISIFLLILLAPSLLFPRFSAWRQQAAENATENARLATITENVSILQQIDTQNLQVYADLVEKLLPSGADQLRVVSLIDELVRRSGARLDSLKVISKAASSAAAATPAPAAGEAEDAAQTATGDTTTTTGTAASAPTQTAGPSSYSVSTTFKGTFGQSLRLLALLDKTKRTISAEKVSFAKEQNSSNLGVTVEFTLPLGKEATVSPETKVELSAADIQILENLLSSLTIDAFPTNLPTGRNDPFN